MALPTSFPVKDDKTRVCFVFVLAGGSFCLFFVFHVCVLFCFSNFGYKNSTFSFYDLEHFVSEMICCVLSGTQTLLPLNW